MKADTPAQLEKFSNWEDLEAELEAVENKHIITKPANKGALHQARKAVVSSVDSFSVSRYCLGEALEKYKMYFKSEQAWMDVATAIGQAMHRGNRTVRNIVSDYRRLKPMPEKILSASHDLDIDLARKKYAPAVEIIQAELASVGRLSDSKAKEILMNAIQRTSKNSSTDELFEELTKEEKAHFKIRMKIRTALNNLEAEEKLPELIAALEEEMYVVWGETSPITITITPRPSMLTIDGRKRKR